MATISQDLVEDVRNVIDEETVRGQSATTDEQIAESLSSNFSDKAILSFLTFATRWVVSRSVAGAHPEFRKQLDGSVSNEGPEDIGTSGFSIKLYRLVGDTVKRDGTIATRRSFSENRTLDRSPSKSYPVWIYEDHKFDGIPDGESGEDWVADVVLVPERYDVTKSISQDTAAGERVIYLESGEAKEIYRGASVEKSSNDADFGRIESVDTAEDTLTITKDAPELLDSSAGDQVDITLSPAYKLQDRFRQPVVERAASQCFLSIGKGGGYQAAKQRAESALESYRINFKNVAELAEQIQDG